MERSGALLKVPPNDVVLRWARDLYENAVDQKDAAGFAAAFTQDAQLQFANAPAMTGRDAIEEAIANFFTTFLELRHEERGAWVVGDTLILEATVTYLRHDEREVSVPAVTIFHLAGSAPDDPERPQADGCRIYVDLAPLYAAAG